MGFTGSIRVRLDRADRTLAKEDASIIKELLEQHGFDVLSVNVREDPVAIKGPSVDALDLCELLAELVERNTGRRPAITREWTSSADRLLSVDLRPLPEATRLLQWSQDDDFWSTNILSMPKFRKQYDQLRLKATRQGPGTAAARYMMEALETRRIELEEERGTGFDSAAPLGLPEADAR